ncbi:AAA family ATPase [Agromyces sp. H66]|uniref:McrB family protein n=1 Tax=Agromyces sp. H66 TaxID=2529859 RepID=UPI00145A405D|nr:AAA family ATPase [Agromyces sp. H66]
MINEDDLPRWQAKLEQIDAAVEGDREVLNAWAAEDAHRADRDGELRAIVDAFQRDGDLVEFRKEVDEWRHRPGPYTSFGGFGQMWLNQVAKYTPEGDTDTIRVLQSALTTPQSIAESIDKINAVARVTEKLTSKGYPQVGRIPYVLSLFWATDRATPPWPVMWTSAPQMMSELGWLRPWSNQERWPEYVEAARTLSPDRITRFDRLLWYLSEHKFVGLNPTLASMCAEAAELMARYTRGVGYADDPIATRAEGLAFQLKGELGLAAEGLVEALSARVDRALKAQPIDARIEFSKTGAYRADAYTVWAESDVSRAPSFRLWATRSGVAVGVHAYGENEADATAIAERVLSTVPEGMTFFHLQPHLTGDRLTPITGYRSGQVFVGRWWTWDEAPQGISLREAVLDVAEALVPVFDAVAPRADRQVTITPISGASVNDELTTLAERFRAEWPYPNEKDSWHKDERAKLAEMLSADNLVVFDLDVFRLLINTSRYGGPGPQSVLNASLRVMDSIALDAFARKVHDILWDPEPVAKRIDRALDWEDLGTKGLGESVVLKMLAIVDPDRFLPVFPLTGPHGKIAMLRRLGLPEPDKTLSRGEQHLAANDTLRARLEPLFPNEPWGQTQFAYWLLGNDVDDSGTEIDLLGRTAAELFVPQSFLEEIRELILEKGQVVFYGPPGTGKTYVADKFAAAIQPDPDRRMLVQFHPSTSYEDFFEGYRPRTDEAGQMSYELRKGPLALMAEKAEAAPGQPHVLIIDELNRANLPRVFGELLYLLEYRRKWVRTAYRADEPFELPANLYFIGTMNTADRSIAMIDAALRRRFHFMPFVPNEGPLSGLLRRWLKENEEPAWIASLVDGVNEELRVLLRGSHLLIGHSHFMPDGAGKGKPTVLEDTRLRRVWNYGVYPMIEDQLYGKPERLAEFTWESVLHRYGPGSTAAAEEQEALNADLESDDA